jgi:hypothetical protein
MAEPSGRLFVEPDPVLDALKEDLAWPFAMDPNGDLRVVGGLQNLESALVGRAITGRGEIPHRPSYGIDFEDLQNGPSVAEEHAVLEARLLEQYEREDRIEDGVTVTVARDESEPGDTIATINAHAKTGQDVSAEVVLTG